MSIDFLFADFDRLIQSSESVHRLRRFILDLAVRGKLAPQDPNDEPASELLKRIAVEKARLVKAGEIRTGKILDELTDADKTFTVPEGWCWARLGNIATYLQRGKSPKYATGTDLLVVSQKCVKWNGLDLSVAKEIEAASLERYEGHRFLRDGDLLWNSTGTGTIGRIIRVESPPEKLVCDSHVTLIRCPHVVSEYLRTWLRSDHVYGVIESRAAGSTKQVELTTGLALNWQVPLPPLAEQHRIVAKVNELMALCDRLEAARAEREATRDRLATASLARLNAPDQETFQHDVAFALNNLAPLTTRPDQIKALRQTILNLAIRGKLVPQDPNDEPASELLEKLSACRTKERRRKKELTPLSEKEKHYRAPLGWKWVRIGEAFSIRTGFAFKSSTYSDSGIFVLRVVNFDRSGAFNLSDAKFFPPEKIDQQISQFVLGEGEVLMVMVGGTIGKTAIVTSEVLPALLNQNMWRIRSFGEILNNEFEYLLIRSINQQIQNLTNSTHGHFAMSDYEQKSICLPPLAEQRRIVAKVNALMALCDRLEASLARDDETGGRLVEAVLYEALEA